ncbi:hypothetical protein BKA66DRAFT_568793 [Pyrenochaeta sp. MPI-SDFR-AT-0127]|nr:hypothetical protein BKA66DRAFT_568793 [Pyrenochaeta sp. MPI-SDFR-AT-0127]
MIRSATALVASSPALRSTTLTDIPESSSAGPSRETSIRTVTRNGLTTASSGMTPECKDLSSTPSQAWDTRTTFRSFVRHRTSVSNRRIPGTPQFILRVRQRIGAKFPALQSSLLGRWFSEEPKLSPKKEGKQPVRETLPSSTPPPVFTSNPVDVEHGTQTNIDDDSKQYNLQGCASSANREDALNTIKAMDQNAMRELTADQRIGWMREQITVFKTLSRPIPPTVTSATVDNGTQVDMDTVDILSVSQRPLVRRHSALPYIGNLFGSFEYWEVLRGSTSTLNGRRFSISDTHLSEADTVFEEASATSAPRNTLSESLRHERSPRPHSTHSIAQNWQQIMQHRMEARRSFDSTATVNVRSITSPRGRAQNRLSRTSARASSIYVTEPSVSQVQLAQSMNEEPGLPSDQERHIAPSESPPTP